VRRAPLRVSSCLVRDTLWAEYHDVVCKDVVVAELFEGWNIWRIEWRSSPATARIFTFPPLCSSLSKGTGKVAT
jgi:hypothetical protein